ncbi:hypothetical protein CYMTET_31738, partial [Cymbomonas tetramitiformis]
MCEYTCKSSFQTIMANTDLNKDYIVTKDEFILSLGNTTHAAYAWQFINAKYPGTLSTGTADFNTFINYYYSSYGIIPFTCEACDVGCLEGSEGCFEFSYDHMDS